MPGTDKNAAKGVQYAALVNAVRNGEASAVYSYSLSCLGRSVSELDRLFRLFAERQVPIRLGVDSVDTSTATGRFAARMLAGVAELEAELAAEPQMARNATKRALAIERGEDPREAVRTSRRYGEQRTVFDREGKAIVLGKGEDAERVRAILKEEGSYTRTARRLNAEGVKVRSDKPDKKWWASTVGVIIERLDPDMGLPRGGKGRRAKAEFALAKLLRCPQDCAMLTGSRLPDKKGKRWTRYGCRHSEATPHPRMSIAEHLILPAIEAEAAMYREPDMIDLDEIEARRQRLSDRRSRVVEARLDGLIDRDDARAQVAEIDRELAELTRPAAPERDLRMVAGMAPGEINAVLRNLFERIDLDPDTFMPVEFVWRNPSWRDED